ncbi:MAG: FAD-dependent oxidoreductase, partial [Chloroflexota bacterium]|nr:FAD-dependent oxidoreductase [Chloroflexota bacterium]
RIAIITEQTHPTINTPSLKQFAMGKLDREQLLAYPIGTECAQRIQLIHGRVEEINAHDKGVRLSSGSIISYGQLLIATGSVASGLPAHLPGRDFDGVLTLHRLQDYINLRRRLNEVDDAVVIGGGAHAIETVMSLLYLGIRTHWLLRKKTCLSGVLDQYASELLLRHIQQAGAKVYTETEVMGIAGNVGAVAGIVTNHHKMIPCQLVAICTGMRPVTTLAERCTLPMMYERNQGIFVNNQLRTNVPGIYAAGDVAALNNPQTGGHETRAQWYSAVVQGASAAAAMTGHMTAMAGPGRLHHPPDAAALPLHFFGVPWHATRLGNLSLVTVGNPLAQTPGSVMLTDCFKGTYRRLVLLGDQLIGYISLGQIQTDGLGIKRLIEEGASIGTAKEALLKGTFDARKYFSQQRSISVMALTHQRNVGARQLHPGDDEGVPALPSASGAQFQGFHYPGGKEKI